MIRPGDLVICECGTPFTYYHGKPGRIRECPECASDVETPVASESDADGEWVPMPRRARQRYEIQMLPGVPFAPASGYTAKGAAL